MVVAILDPNPDIKQTCLIKSSSRVYDHISLSLFPNQLLSMANILTFSTISPIFGDILARMVVAILDLKHGIIQICLIMVNKEYVAIFNGSISILSNTYGQYIIFFCKIELFWRPF